MSSQITPKDGKAESQQGTAKRRSTDRLGFVLLLAMVAFAPVPDGSVASVWVQLWTVVASIALLLLTYRDVTVGVLFLMACLLVLVVVYCIVALLQSSSPGLSPLPIWFEASTILGIGIPPLSSSMRDTPVLFLGRPLLAALVLSAAMVVGADRKRANLLLGVIVASGCLYVLIGFVSLVFDLDNLNPYNEGGPLTTFFLNKNTTAVYLGSIFLISFASLAPRGSQLLNGGKPLSQLFIGAEGRRRLVMATAGIFVVMLLPLTLSRGGVMLTAIISISAILVRLRFRKFRNVVKLILGGLVLMTVVYVLSGEIWRERQSRVGFDSLGRIEAYEQMLRAAWEHAWLGLGLGSFAQSFPQFRTAELGLAGIFNIGHSTPIELIFEGGFPLALVVFLFTLVCAIVLVRGALRRPSDSRLLAAALVGLLGLIHTCFDFSLQIPGYLIIYMSVVGVGLARSFLPPEISKSHSEFRTSQSS